MLDLGLYRISTYLISVDLEQNNQYMLIHGYSGAMDLVGKDLWHFFRGNNITVFSKEELPCSRETADLLERRCYITSLTQEEEYQYVERLAMALHKRTQILNATFTFVVSYGCNFRCPYCYEGDKSKNIVFTRGMVDKAFKLIEEIQPDKRLRFPVLALYGGEPLLKENGKIVRYILSKGKVFGMKFKVVTNGYDLDTYADVLFPDIIDSLQITIDGIKERHDKKRIHRDGVSTFDRIVRNIGIVLKNGVHVLVRVNTDKQNLEDIPLLEDLFKSLYPDDIDKLKIKSALLRDYSKEQGNSNFFSQVEFMKIHRKFDFRYGCEDCGILKNVYHAISERKPLNLRAIYCGAQSNSYVLDPLGKIYACWEVIGKKEFEMGNYAGVSVIWSKSVFDKWREHNILTLESCRYCKYALLCGGGCANKNLSRLNYCTHVSVMLKYAINLALKKCQIIV